MFGGKDRPGLGEERKPAGEDEAVARIVEAERKILQHRVDVEKLPNASQPVPRGQHPKHHGCVRADFVVEADVPARLRFGVFQEPGRRFPAWVRFSNARVKDDREAGGHGMSIKLMDVAGLGPRLGGDSRSTQDFLLLDSPVFFIKDALEYASFEEALEKAEVGGSWFSKLSVLGYFLTHPFELAILKKIQSTLPVDPLAETYWSATPYRLGPEPGGLAVKYKATPARGHTTPVPPPEAGVDQLRHAMAAHLKTLDAAFDFYVQPQEDATEQPVEDPTVLWDEESAPCIKVATIRIAAGQPFEKWMNFCENLSFTPWRGLADHRPLGGINRARAKVYEELSAMRHRLNGAPQEEPTPGTDPEE